MRKFPTQTPKVFFVSTWPPNQCGVGTFCHDLIEGIKKNNPNFPYEVLAVTPKNKKIAYDKKVSFIIQRENLTSYFKAADYINSYLKNSLVCLQHEFSMYGGNSGKYVIPFLERIEKPKICVIHNAMSFPFSNISIFSRLNLLKQIGGHSNKIIVMTQMTKRILNDFKIFPKIKVEVIGHGIPEFLFEENSEKKPNPLLRFKNKKIIGAWGILTDRKGYEFLISALPKIRKVFPETRLAIFGKVSSRKLIRVYFRYLKNLVKTLKLEKYVYFKKQFLPESELKKFLERIDIFVTPYNILDHSSSGTLLFAMAAGKPVISTSYIFAQEVLKDNRGILVPFSDRTTLADAIIYLFSNPSEVKKIGEKAKKYASSYRWPKIAQKYLDLFNQIGKS